MKATFPPPKLSFRHFPLRLAAFLTGSKVAWLYHIGQQKMHAVLIKNNKILIWLIYRLKMNDDGKAFFIKKDGNKLFHPAVYDYWIAADENEKLVMVMKNYEVYEELKKSLEEQAKHKRLWYEI